MSFDCRIHVHGPFVTPDEFSIFRSRLRFRSTQVPPSIEDRPYTDIIIIEVLKHAPPDYSVLIPILTPSTFAAYSLCIYLVKALGGRDLLWTVASRSNYPVSEPGRKVTRELRLRPSWYGYVSSKPNVTGQLLNVDLKRIILLAYLFMQLGTPDPPLRLHVCKLVGYLTC